MKQKKRANKSSAFRFRRFDNKAYSAFNSMRRIVNIGVMSSCLLVSASMKTATAQTTTHQVQQNASEIEDQELDEVSVTTSRVALSANQSAKLVTIITREEIQRSPIQSIQDLLNYASGVDVIQRGGHGVQADISIRGGSFDQTAILLNGVNLSNPQTGHLSFDIPINLNDIERLEIIHGPSSIVYGASALSGGINIITKKKPDHTAYGKIEAGSHNLWNIEAGAALNTKTTNNQLSVGYRSSDGYIQNSDYDIFNLLWQTRLNIEKSKLDIQLGYNDKQFGANTFYSAEYPNQYEKTNSYFASVKAETGDKLKFIPHVYWNRHNDCFQLYREGTPNLPDWYKGHNYHRTDVYGANFNLQYKSNYGITSFGAEFRNEGILSNVLGKPLSNPDGKFTKSDDRTNISYVLEHNILLHRFTLIVGLLMNYNTAIKGDYKFYPSVNASYWITDDLKAYGSWAKATRMPTFTDLYYTAKTHTGNTNLKPETSESFEIGLKYGKSFIQSYLTAYLMKGKNLIDWVKENPDDLWESRNLTTLNKKGIEVGAKILFEELIPSLKTTSLQLGYTRLNQNKESGKLISNYALNYLRDKFTTQLHHPIYKNISANWSFRWQKRMGAYIKYENLKPAEQVPYTDFSTLDLRIDWKLQNWNIQLSANNIFDTKYYDLGNIPQAGFWLISGVSCTF